MMQYSHGICAATASPISCLVLPSSAVLGFISNDFAVSHHDGNSVAGTTRTKAGTNPIIPSISLSVAAAGDGVGGGAVGLLSAAAEAEIAIAIRAVTVESLVIGCSLV